MEVRSLYQIACRACSADLGLAPAKTCMVTIPMRMPYNMYHNDRNAAHLGRTPPFSIVHDSGGCFLRRL